MCAIKGHPLSTLWNLDTAAMSTTIGKCGEFCSEGHMSHGKKQLSHGRGWNSAELPMPSNGCNLQGRGI